MLAAFLQHFSGSSSELSTRVSAQALALVQQVPGTAGCIAMSLWTYTSHIKARVRNNNNNNNNTIWGGSVLTGEEPPPHSGELKHALPQAGGPTQSQLSRPMSSGHHISMDHRLRRKHLNSDTNASNKKYLKEMEEKRKEQTFFGNNEKRKWKTLKNQENEEMNKK